MLWRLNSVVLTIVGLLLVVPAGSNGAKPVNESVPADLYWSTAREEEDLIPGESSSYLNDQEDLDSDGGFSSLDAMLQWAIGHSDPTKLKETAKDFKNLSSDELERRRIEMKELMEKLKMPSDAQLMQTAIDDLNNSTLSLEDHRHAMQELLILVEPIDNANNLQKHGGLSVVIKGLSHSDLQMRTSSAWVLGKACQNNPVVQKQLLQLGALEKLMKMVRSDFVEEAIKALYAVSALIRNNLDGQELFCREGGELMLQEILSNASVDIRLLRKTVFILADLVEFRLENENNVDLPSFSSQFFWKSVVDLLAAPDLDLLEKALYAIKNLLLLRSTEALVFKELCKLDMALEKLEKQFKLLLTGENHTEYAMDLESLRREVLQIFLEKLDKA